MDEREARPGGERVRENGPAELRIPDEPVGAMKWLQERLAEGLRSGPGVELEAWSAGAREEKAGG